VTRQVIVEGIGLHTGTAARVLLQATEGEVRLRVNGVEAALDELAVSSTDRATTLEARGGAIRVQTVEHALAALAGLGVREGVTFAVDGNEMPLLDGGADAWCHAIKALGVPRGNHSRIRVTRRATVHVGKSRYEWSPSRTTEVQVCLEVDDERLARDAAWSGDAEDFHARIAPARTFAFSRDVDDLLVRGLARHVNPESVVLVAPETIYHAGRPFSPDEPARHKLLDLLGDMYLSGGPPVGRVRVVRPGHAANAIAFRQAFAEGVLAAVQ
jgi:UDP-3-O-[3-hydroxymyristoyl] N-acetylglucosamine deacetylase